MKTEFEDAARNVEQTVASEINQTTADLNQTWRDDALTATSAFEPAPVSPPQYERPKKNWRLKRGATPQWYKQRAGVRVKALSGAARVARFRPPPAVR